MNKSSLALAVAVGVLAQQAGAAGFGIGSSLFKPGKTAAQVAADAQAFASNYRALHKA